MIRVQYHLEPQETEETSLLMEVNESTPEATDGHGLNEEGVIACCRRGSSLGLVDCSACLDEAWNRLHDALDSNSRDTARELLGVLRQSKEQGTKKLDIIVSVQILLLSRSDGIMNRICSVHLTPTCRSFWIDYSPQIFLKSTGLDINLFSSSRLTMLQNGVLLYLRTRSNTHFRDAGWTSKVERLLIFGKQLSELS